MEAIMQERKGDLKYKTAETFDDDLNNFVPVWSIFRATGDGAWLHTISHLKSRIDLSELLRLYPGITPFPGRYD
jgi:hypothetical protein